MSSLHQRVALAMLALILAGAALPALAEYPEQSIKLVLPFAPGGETDPFARALGTGLTKYLGQPIVIENKPGAGGAIAFEAVARAPKDGYTLLMGFSNPLVVNPHLYKKLPYSVENDFAPISLMAEGQFLLVINSEVPAKTVPEFIEYLKANPNKLNFASAGVGSPLHVAAELFMSRTGTKMVHVPYKSGGDAARGILTGEAQVVFGSPSAAAANIKTGKVRALAVTGSKRLPTMPDLPTISESGLPGFEVTAWHSLVAPAGTPQPVLDKLHGELMKVLNSPELREQAERQGLVVLTSTPEGLRDRIRTESAMWGKVIRDAGITPE
jgi:tripartite-type tricarboxylate transporter receptor subunit TctC